MTSYDLGGTVAIPQFSVFDINGAPINATVTLTLTKPDGTTTNPATTNPSTGIYLAYVVPDQAGTWIYHWLAAGAAAASASGQYTVSDPAAPLFCTLAELKLHLGITDTADDTLLLKAIATASRSVAKWCGGRKFTLSATATARIYVPSGDYELFVDDIGSMVGLLVETGSGGVYTTQLAASYEATPTTALARSEPITSFQDVNYTGIWWAGGVAPRVRVTARWGWPSLPDEISHATLLSAARLYRRKGSPEGVAGFNDLGVVRVVKLDPDVQALIAPFKRYAIA